MKLPDFKVEQWMNEYEHEAVYNLTDTCVSPLTFTQLAAFDSAGSFMHVKLDYGIITGDTDLKEQILSMYQTGTEDNVTVMQGCLQANETVMYTLLEPGDTVITFEPGYQQFSEIPRSLGCNVLTLGLYEENGWQPDIGELEESMKNVIKMIIVNQPSNPTGTLLSPEYVQKMIELARKQGTYILSDEVYRGLSDEVPLSDLYERAISTASLSKVFSLAGLRLGWIKGPADVIAKINVRRDYSIISTGPLIDQLACTALRHKEEILERSRRIIQMNRKTVQEFLDSHPRFHMVLPQSGTVGFMGYDHEIDDTMLAEGLLKKEGVFFVPGSCFNCAKHLRLGFTCEEGIMKAGLEKLNRYLEELNV